MVIIKSVQFPCINFHCLTDAEVIPSASDIVETSDQCLLLTF